ncbi:MAG: aminopeptidase P family protein [Candidatus Pelagibacter sp. TMED153]|nr:MAG: aminopeptidase P family protein [Candidatus Pelagibacter sp. TMED153]|tara:strand:+ start:1626 stop:3344 length:1719 start_codon:yes stop_codon:yes gene_type:complete
MEKINKLRKLLNDYGLDGYLVPKNDEFFGEYIPQKNDKLRFISNFSGSYGFALILKNKNYLFVDGRYTQQAKIQSGKLFDIITIPNKYPSNILKKVSLKIGFDPKLHTQKILKIFFNKTNCKLISLNQNLIEKLWIKKKSNNLKKFYALPEKAVGQNYKLKINKLFKILKKKKIDFQFISASENIAWLMNIRGYDSEFTPIPNAYLTLDYNKKINFFCDLKKINYSFKKRFKDIKFVDIKYTNLFLSEVKDKKILIDSSTCSIYFENILKKNNKIVEFLDPVYSLKSIKSKIEIKNTIKCHIHDGVALTKFLFWIKKNYNKQNIDEITAQEKLLKLRKKNRNFRFLSFPTISGSGPNGAIIHYKASEKSNRKLKKGDIYLVDSGGQYNFGTTDVTRTISLNNSNKRIKDIFTRVLRSHIAVASFKLKSKTCGAQIDGIARKPLREINLDYTHGTGHGVGYFLNVHEGPQAISKNNKVNFKEGMIVSNEPGYYENGKFGIRIENLIRVKKNKKGYLFDNLTMAPIDKSLINKSILKKNELNWLNNYHKKVFDNLKKFMKKSELLDLKQACSKI